MEHSPGQITQQATEKVTTNLRRQEQYQVHCRSPQYDTRNQLQKEKWIKHKYMENKEHTTKKPISQ